MLQKKKIALLLSAVIILVIIGAGYMYLDHHPKPFPSHEAAVGEMGRYNKTAIQEVLEVIPIDDVHVVVPFVSENNEYGIGLWKWEALSWKLKKIVQRGEPFLWKLKEKDPSSHVLIWNMNPSDQISAIDYYLMRERSYYGTDEHNTYQPRIQLKHRVDASTRSYGAIQLPEVWLQLLEDERAANRSSESFSLFSSFSPRSSIAINWLPRSAAGEFVFPKHTVNGGSYVLSDVSTSPVYIIDPHDLE